MMRYFQLNMQFGDLTLNQSNCFVIGEIGLNHNGSVELAEKMVYESLVAGATFVKFQKRTPSVLARPEYLDKPFIKAPSMGRTQRQVRERHELSKEEYKHIFNYAESLGLIPFATAFDTASLDFLVEDIGCRYIKIASHSATNEVLVRRALETKLPLVISMGATKASERAALKEIIDNQHGQVVVMHCVSEYPTLAKNMKLDTISALQEEFGKECVGFSSHENGYSGTLAAVALGAVLVERHITISRAMVGLDHGISMEAREFADMVIQIKEIKKMGGVKSDVSSDEINVRKAYHSGMYARKSIEQGEELHIDMFDVVQPLSDEDACTSMEFKAIGSSKLKVSIKSGELLKIWMLE